MDVENLASQPELVNVSTPVGDQDRLLEQFTNFSNYKYLSASLYDGNGTLLASSDANLTNKNPASAESIKQPLNDGRPFFDKSPKVLQSNQTGFYYSAPVYDADGEIKRVIVVSVPIDFIDEKINASVLHQDSEDFPFNFKSKIFDDNGYLIYSNSHYNSASSSSLAVGDDPITGIIPRQSADVTQPEEEEEGYNLPKSIVIKVAENSDRKSFEDNVNWTLELEGDLSPLLSGFNSTINEFLLLSSVTLAITIGTTFLLIRKTILPLTKLKDVALEISKGNFSKPILVEGANEVKDLSISLEVMRRSIENLNKNLVNSIDERTKELRKAIEELRIKESQVKTINDELVKANVAKEEFLYMVSHEIKDPITPMKLCVEMLLKTSNRDDLNEFQKKVLNTVHKNILKLETIVNDMFTVYKLDLGNFTINKKIIDIKELIESNAALLSPMMKEKNIAFKLIINTDSKVLCDPIGIGQVLINLVNNAIDHVPEVGGNITIRIDELDSFKPNDIKGGFSETSSKKIIFTIQDNGVDIPAHKIENLFKKFYLIDTGLRRKYVGTGLRLAICKSIIECHGGKIWVDPSYKNGVSFKFSLDACS